jgi:hypothetical protein
MVVSVINGVMLPFILIFMLLLKKSDGELYKTKDI